MLASPSFNFHTFSSINQNQNNTTEKVNNVTTAFGNGSRTSVNGPVSIATIYAPYGISINPITQEVYIAEAGTGNIRAWNRTSQTVRDAVANLFSINPFHLDFMNDGVAFIAQNSGLLKLFPNGLYLIICRK